MLSFTPALNLGCHCVSVTKQSLGESMLVTPRILTNREGIHHPLLKWVEFQSLQFTFQMCFLTGFNLLSEGY